MITAQETRFGAYYNKARTTLLGALQEDQAFVGEVDGGDDPRSEEVEVYAQDIFEALSIVEDARPGCRILDITPVD